MSRLILELPDGVSAEQVSARVVMDLHQEGQVTLAQAAQMLGLSVHAYMDQFNASGRTLFNYAPSELGAVLGCSQTR